MLAADVGRSEQPARRSFSFAGRTFCARRRSAFCVRGIAAVIAVSRKSRWHVSIATQGTSGAETSPTLGGCDELVPRREDALWMILPTVSSVVTHVVVAPTITRAVSSSFAPNARPTLRSCWRFKTGSTASQTKRRNHAPRLNSRPVIANDTTCARQAGCRGNSDLAFDR